MKYDSKDMERETLLHVAFGMCTAARTAPKARGIDNICTTVLTGAEKLELANKMEEIAETQENCAFFHRDAMNIRVAAAVVLIGVKKKYTGLNYCSMCGFENCAVCAQQGARCAFNTIDLGIAIGSAVSYAADHRADNRVMFSVGRAYAAMNPEEEIIWHGIPLFAYGKNPTFDRG